MTKEQLVAEVLRSRASVAKAGDAIRAELDLASKLDNSIRRKPLAWLGGAAALGWWFAGPKTRTRVVTKRVRAGKSGAEPKEEKIEKKLGLWAILLAIFRLAMPLLKPALTAYAGKRLAEFSQRLAK